MPRPHFSPPNQAPPGPFPSPTKISPLQGSMRPVQPGVGQGQGASDMPNGVSFRSPAGLPQSGNIPAQSSMSQGQESQPGVVQSPLKLTASHQMGALLQSNPFLHSPTGSMPITIPKELQNLVSSGMSKQELSNLLSCHNITTSLAETLLAQFSQSCEKKMDKSVDIHSANSSQSQAQNKSAQSSVSGPTSSGQSTGGSNSHSSAVGQDSASSNVTDHKDISSTNYNQLKAICRTTSQEQPTRISISMSASEILEVSKNYGMYVFFSQ